MRDVVAITSPGLATALGPPGGQSRGRSRGGRSGEGRGGRSRGRSRGGSQGTGTSYQDGVDGIAVKSSRTRSRPIATRLADVEP